MNTREISEHMVESAKLGAVVATVTSALSLAAIAARDNERMDALAIREGVDAFQKSEAEHKEYMDTRLQIATTLMAYDVYNISPKAAIEYATELMCANILEDKK